MPEHVRSNVIETRDFLRLWMRVMKIERQGVKCFTTCQTINNSRNIGFLLKVAKKFQTPKT